MNTKCICRPQAIKTRLSRGAKWAIALLTLVMTAAVAMPALAQQTKTTVIYVYTNAQGTPLAEADAQGHIIKRYTYRPYGTQQSGPTSATPGYTGHVHDAATGLVYMQQRYYDPITGRFISPDPVTPTPGNLFNFGRYTYANDNPIRFTDPDGRQPCPQCLYYPPSIAGSYQHQAEIRQGASRDALEGTAVAAAGAVLIVTSGGTDTPEVVVAAADVAVDAASDAGAEATTEVADAATNSAKSTIKQITKSSRNRVKRLIKNLSDNSRQDDGISQEKTDQLRRIVKKSGGRVRNDGASGVKGSSAGKPHVQTEGLGKSIDHRHIWTQDGVQ